MTTQPIDEFHANPARAADAPTTLRANQKLTLASSLSDIPKSLFLQPKEQTYALLDAAKVAGLPEMLAASGLPHVCLFENASEDELGDVVPWLVALEPEAQFTTGLLTRGDAPWELWDNHPGIFVWSEMPLQKLGKYLSRFTKVTDPTGRSFYFRFWEGDFLARVLDDGDPATRTALLEHCAFGISSYDGETLTRYQADQRSDAPRLAFTLRDQDRAALTAASADRFLYRLVHWVHSEFSETVDIEHIRSLAIRGRQQVGLRSEATLGDYVALALLDGMPPEERYDLVSAGPARLPARLKRLRKEAQARWQALPSAS
jgi:hypothetical protein